MALTYNEIAKITYKADNLVGKGEKIPWEDLTEQHKDILRNIVSLFNASTRPDPVECYPFLLDGTKNKPVKFIPLRRELACCLIKELLKL